MSSAPKDNLSDTNKQNKQPDQSQEAASKKTEPDDDAIDPGKPFPVDEVIPK